jgi:oxalate decarboxylase/phosphoglucose isomerase-like protein (cupin superfamily)
VLGSENIWMGLSVLPPGGRTAWHTTAISETALYVLSGVGRWWIGDDPADVREAHPGDFAFVPPNVPHWEENGSADEPVEMIVARSTQEALVVTSIGRCGGRLSAERRVTPVVRRAAVIALSRRLTVPVASPDTVPVSGMPFRFAERAGTDVAV